MDLTEFDHQTGQSHLTDSGITYYTGPSKERIPHFDTTFIASERDVLTHITGRQRFIVLNAEARKGYDQKFGDERDPGYAALMLLVSTDESKAYLNVTYHQSGENFALEKKGQRWMIQSLTTTHWD